VLVRLRVLAALVPALLCATVGLAGTARATSATAGSCPPRVNANGPAGLMLTLAPSGTSAVVGTPHTITATLTSPAGGPVAKLCLDLTQNAGPSTGWPQFGYTDAQGQVQVTWTSRAAGTDSITVTYTTPQSATPTTATIRHTWTAPPPPPPSPTPSPTGSPTPSPSGSPTAAPTPSGTPVAVPGSLPGGSIQLDRPSTLPGGTVPVRGRNCPPGAAVTFDVEGAAAGSTTAAPDGTFGGDVQLPDASIGEHLLRVSCDHRTATVPVDLVVSSSVSTPAVGATAAAVLVFFVLLGSVLLSRHRPAPKRAAADEQETP
jgi:hypothetical protein